MRKISILSLIAVLSATPMMAEAARTVTKENYSAPTANTDVASTSYVQGAYKAAADRIDALVDDTAVASAASGTYVAVSADSTVGENLQALDSRVKSLESTTNNAIGSLDDLEGDAAGVSTIVAAINAVDSALDSRLDTLEGSGEGSVAKAEADAKAYADSGTATLTNKTIDAGSNTINGLGTGNFGSDAIVDYTDGIASSVNSASDTALVTEKAVVAALATVNGDVEGKQDQLTAGGSNIATTVVQAANVGEVSASGVNSASDSSLVTQKAALSAALAAETAANAYTDSKRLTVYTTWNSTASSAIALSNAN